MSDLTLNNDIAAVIIAGGEGRRLRPLTNSLPKPLLKVGDKSILSHQLALLNRHGIREVYLLLGYKSTLIQSIIGDGRSCGVHVNYLTEAKPRGTAGCLFPLAGRFSKDFLVLYGDVMLDLSLHQLVAFHLEKQASATLVVHPNDHPSDSDLVCMNKCQRVTGFLPKGAPRGFHRNLVSAGLYVLKPDVFKYIPAQGLADFMRDVFPFMLIDGYPIYGFLTSEYVKDMGTPARLAQVRRDYTNGLIDKRSLRAKRPAIFLDRDGTLIEHVHLLHRSSDLKIFPFAAKAIRRVNESDHLCIIATNQSVVARNLCGFEDVEQIHAKLETMLGEQGAYLDGIYFCPHHPHGGYPEEDPRYKCDCQCRKPKPGMLHRAIQEFNLDPDASWIIGDSLTDIEAGKNAGLGGKILLRAEDARRITKTSVQPDFVFAHLEEAIRFILDGKPHLDRIASQIADKIDLKSDRTIIAVGGLARSGKSTFVACLLEALKTRAVSYQLLTLDDWIVEESLRDTEMTVRDRFPYRQITVDIDRLLAGHTVTLYCYEAFLRKKTEHQLALKLNDCRCLIIEGVPALDITKIRSLAHFKLYVQVDEVKRRQRFFSYYQWKQFSMQEIQQLYEQRQIDEAPYITASKMHADLIINQDATS